MFLGRPKNQKDLYGFWFGLKPRKYTMHMEWSTLFKTKPVVQISETLKSGVFFIYLSNKKKKNKAGFTRTSLWFFTCGDFKKLRIKFINTRFGPEFFFFYTFILRRISFPFNFFFFSPKPKSFKLPTTH